MSYCVEEVGGTYEDFLKKRLEGGKPTLEQFIYTHMPEKKPQEVLRTLYTSASLCAPQLHPHSAILASLR